MKKKVKKRQTKKTLKETWTKSDRGTTVLELFASTAEYKNFTLAAIADNTLTIKDLIYQAEGNLTLPLQGLLVGAFIKRSLEDFVEAYEKENDQKRACTELKAKFRGKKVRAKRTKVV